jgi:hypothetical protein
MLEEKTKGKQTPEEKELFAVMLKELTEKAKQHSPSS